MASSPKTPSVCTRSREGFPEGNSPWSPPLMAVEVGVRIVRGPDWSWEDQDGGEGSVGTLVEVKESVPEEEGTFPSGTTVKVCWDIGVLSNYRCGFDEKYDLLVFDNAQTGESDVVVGCWCHGNPAVRG